MSYELRTCRICKEQDTTKRLFKTAVRHYVHAKCGLLENGTDFLNSLHAWQLRGFPVLVLADFLKELKVKEKAVDMLHRKIGEVSQVEADVRRGF